MNRPSAFLVGSLALVSISASTNTVLSSDGSPLAVFAWVALGLSGVALALAVGALVRASRRR